MLSELSRVVCLVVVQAEEKPQLLWQLLDEWPGRQASPGEECWEAVIGTASAHLPPSTAKAGQIAFACGRQ